MTTIEERVKKLIKEHINEEEFEECPYCKAIAYLDHGPSKFCFCCTFTFIKQFPVGLDVQLEWHGEDPDAGPRLNET